MSDQMKGIAGIRATLAAKHPKFAAADEFERKIENACVNIRSTLKAARKELGIDQSTLAERMQVGQPMISRIENGTGDIGIKTLYRYADALGLTLAVEVAKADDLGAPPPESASIAVGEALENVDKARELLSTAAARLTAVA